MKRFIQLIALLMAVMMIAGTALADNTATTELYNDTTFYVDMTDQNSQRAVLTFGQKSNGTAECTIHWADSADTCHVWQFSWSGNAIAEDGGLAYNDCVCSVVTTSEDGPEAVQVLYENGTGMLIPTEGGYAWQDDQEDAGKDCMFVPDEGQMRLSTNYVDTVSQRASMTLSGILAMDEQVMNVTITWPESADIVRMWIMTVKSEPVLFIDENTATMAYTDCICKRLTYDENGDVTESILYENGSGALVMCYADGLDGEMTIGYSWQPDAELMTENCLFVPNMIEGPAGLKTIDPIQENTALTALLNYAHAMEDCNARSQIMAEAEKLDMNHIIAVDGLGTMDDDPNLYCLDAYECHVEHDGFSTSISYDSDDFQRKLMAADMIAVVPADMENLMDGGYAVTTTAADFAAWYDAACANLAERPVMLFQYVEDNHGNVKLLVFDHTLGL